MKKIGEIDYDLKLPKKSLFLCLPNKKTIAKIGEAYDIQYYTKLSTVNELSFKIPSIIVKDDVPMENPNIERIKHRYIFKLVVGNTYEYFLFSEQNKSYGDDEFLEYRAYSLGVQLTDKNVRSFNKIGNLQEVSNAVLEDVYGNLEEVPIKRWTVGYVDSYFVDSDSADRDYTVGSMSLLEAIYDIAEKWNAVIKWNTEDLVIDFYRPENIGLNKGFYIRDGKYLENFNLSVDSSSTVTRLRAFGSDNLTFRKLNPIGEDYIEDFSYYMYPFEYDRATNKVLKSSDYMSDSLCIAITKAKDLVESKKGDFEKIIEKISTLQGILAIEEQQLAKLTTERVLLEDERDVLLAEFQKDKDSWGKNGWNDKGTKEGTQQHAKVISKLRAKEAEESTQMSAVSNAKFNLQDAEKERQNLIDLFKPSNNYTTDEWSELQQFIIVKEYVNEAITNEEDLLKEAQIVFKQQQEPKIVLSLNIIDFLSVVECQNDWDKLGLGDTIKIRYDRLKVNILAKIIEINYDFENFTINLTIANEKDLKDGSQELMDLLNKADITSTIVSMDKNGWNLSKENNGKINDLINNKWDSLKQAVMAGYEQQITISERGIVVKSLDDPNSWLVIQNGFLAITNDSGNTWKHAISKDGIWGEHIFGKLISGVNLYIEDESGAWKTQGSRTTIYNKDEKEVMWLGLVSDNSRDQFDNVLRQDEAECFGLKSWNDHTKVEVTDCKGIAVSRWRDDDWEEVFWADASGTLHTKHLVTQGIKIVNDDGDMLIDAENNILNIGKIQNIVADGKLTTLEKLQIATQLHEIHTDYKNTLAQAEKYNRSNADITYNLDAQWNEGTGFPIQSVNQISHCDNTQLVKAYTTLINYISQFIPIKQKGISIDDSLLIDYTSPLMEETSVVENRGYFIQVFRDYYDESAKLKQAIEDSLFYSGINMGKYYNNLMMGRQGFVAVRNDGKYRAYLNATNGLVLEKWEKDRWTKKLYGAIGDSNWEDGTLIAEGLVTKNLKIVDAEMGERITFDWDKGITINGDNAKIYLNANDSIKITDLDGDEKFWVDTKGSLFAKDITTHNLKIVNGELGEKIIFDENDGITINGNKGEQIRLNANDGIAIDVNKEKRFWVGTDGNLYAKKLYIQGEDEEMIEDIDGSYISDLTVNSLKTLDKGTDSQDIVHIEKNFMRFNTWYNGSEKTKLEFTYEGTGLSSYPVMKLGTPLADKAYGNGSEVAKIYKDDTRFAIEYDAPSGKMTKFYFNEGDTDNEGQAVYFESEGGIRFHSDNKFVAKVSNTQYLRISKDEDIALVFGDNRAIIIDKQKMRLQFGASNYVEISESGIRLIGSRIDLN